MFRTHFDSVSRRRKDATRVRKAAPRKITLDNVDQYDVTSWLDPELLLSRTPAPSQADDLVSRFP